MASTKDVWHYFNWASPLSRQINNLPVNRIPRQLIVGKHWEYLNHEGGFWWDIIRDMYEGVPPLR